MSQDWNQLWTDYAASAQVNPAQAYRRRRILEELHLGEPRGGIRLLDIGSGQGDFAELIARLCPEVRIAGLDISPSGVAFSRTKVPAATFLERDLLVPEDPPEAFRAWADRAVCSELLEHVEEPVRLLRNLHGWLAPGCRLVVTVPGGPISAFDRHIGHVRHFRKADLEKLLQEAGFREIRVDASGWPFFNLYRLLVVARGRRLARDVAAGGDGGRLPLAARLAMGAFSHLFRLNASRRLGWQMVATATWPGA